MAAVWLRKPEAERPRWAWMVAAGAVAPRPRRASWPRSDASLAARLHLKDARLLHPEHAAGFVRSVARIALAAGTAALVVAVPARGGRPWAVRLARREVLIVGAAAAGGFLLGTPYAALDPVAFLSDLAFNHQTRFEYKGLTGASTSFGPYLLLLAAAADRPAAGGGGRGRPGRGGARAAGRSRARWWPDRGAGPVPAGRGLGPPGAALPGPRLPRRGRGWPRSA